MAAPLLIGVSARIHHPTDHPVSLGGVFTKTLHYLEQSVAHWVMSRTDGFRRVAREIASRYVAAHDPDAEVDDYIGPEDGVWVEVIADRVRAWDYADAAYT